MKNFTEEQRQKARKAYTDYLKTTDDLYDEMHRRLEEELGIDGESVGRLLEEI